MMKVKIMAVVLAMLVCAATSWAANPRPIAERDGAGTASFETGTAEATRPAGAPVDYDASTQAGADYMRRMQADVTEDNAGNGTDGTDENPDDPDDAGWDWRVTSPPAPFSHTTAASPTNLYGVSALGLYYAHLESGDAAQLTALQDAADQAVAAGDSVIRTGSDMKFLMLFNDLVGGPTVYQDAAKAKYDARITTYGSATALAEYIRDLRGVTQPYPNGIIGWDIGIYAVVAQMLFDRYGAPYDADADAIAEVLWQDSFNGSPGLFDIVADAGWDPTYTDKNFWWYTLGVTGLIDAFDASGSHTDEISGLVTRLLDSQYAGGAISGSYGANTDDEDWQSTAYAMMSLGGLDQATYQTEINWMGLFLVDTQDGSGGWVYGSGNHYPEIGGECTSGLYFTRNDVCDGVGLDPGEECDGGVGCTDCVCDPAYEPTDPPSLDCRESVGACCNYDPGVCTSSVTASACAILVPDADQRGWFKDEACIADGGTIDCPEHEGACCDHAIPTCLGWMTESACMAMPLPVQPEWFKGVTCGDPGFDCWEHTGACCVAGSCTDDVPESDCRTWKWWKDTPCSDPEVAGVCEAQIPTLPEWGLAALMLLVLTAGTVVFGRRRQAAA